MKLDRDSIIEILSTLTRNKSRTILTGFGVFWGMFMLLVLLGGSAGLKSVLYEEFEGFATNATFIIANTTTKPYQGFKKGRVWQLSLSDVQRIKTQIPELENITPINFQYGSKATYLQNSFEIGSISGVSPEYVQIEAPKLKYGRFINQMDMVQGRKVCVIGVRIYENLFPDGGDPCGKFIQVDNIYYQVIGVDARTAGSISINGRPDRKVTIPITTMNRLYNKGEDVEGIAATAREGYKLTDLEPEIRKLVARAHKIDPTDKEGIYILNLEQIFGIVNSLFTGIDILMLMVGLGTILAGAIGISNIMMVTVKERTTEIGIRRAIGATPSMILSQIIAESIVLTVVSGLIGIVLSVVVLALTDIVVAAVGYSASFQISFSYAAVAAIFLTILGVLAGLAPASRAMNIKPVDAMRDE